MSGHWIGGLAAAMVALTVAAPAASSEALASTGATAIVGKFKRSGAGLACVFMLKDGVTMDDVDVLGADGPCMRTGPVVLGLPRKEAEALLGRPLTTIEDRGDAVFIYPLTWSGAPEASDLLAYAAVAYDTKDQVKLLQLSGEKAPSAGDWAFSAVRLGDPDTAVLASLGEPFSRSPVADNGAELWSYSPWAFSFEIKNGKVTSIRLSAS